jgi:hypothetical protein
MSGCTDQVRDAEESLPEQIGVDFLEAARVLLRDALDLSLDQRAGSLGGEFDLAGDGWALHIEDRRIGASFVSAQAVIFGNDYYKITVEPRRVLRDGDAFFDLRRLVDPSCIADDQDDDDENEDWADVKTEVFDLLDKLNDGTVDAAACVREIENLKERLRAVG